MAHYQLSYGFNSSENMENVNNNCTESLKMQTSEIQNVENHPESILNISTEKNEAEKRKLSQPSEPGKNLYLYSTQ